MNNIIPLKKCATYVTDKIQSSTLTINNYVTTDNLLPSKSGVVCAEKLPSQAGNVTAFKKGDVLISNIRPYLKKIWLASQDGGCSADVLTIRAGRELDSVFLYYALFRDDFFKHVMNGAKGTKMPRGDKNQIMDFLIPKININEQKKIAYVLSVLDKKIEVNNRIYAELELMAKTLYDYWFVQFDYPDINGKPYKKSGGKMVYNSVLDRDIPDGWSVCKLSDISNIITGKLDSNAEVLTGMYPFFTCSKEPSKIDNYSFDGDAVLIAGNNAQGNFHVNRYSGKFNAYQRTYVMTAKDDKYFNYIYQVVVDKMKIYKNQGKGSQTKFLTIGMLTDISVFDSCLGLMSDYHKVTKPLYAKQMNIINENESLRSLRDWLLPMLMNGQVTVK